MTGRQRRVNRGGTSTDIVARRPALRLPPPDPLRDSPTRYADTAAAGSRSRSADSREAVEAVRRGTTAATNALLGRVAGTDDEAPVRDHFTAPARGMAAQWHGRDGVVRRIRFHEPQSGTPITSSSRRSER